MLAEDEQSTARSIVDYFLLAQSSARALAAAFVLIEFVRRNDSFQPISHDWTFTAARDGALQIYNVGQSIRYVRKIAGTLSSARHLIDFDLLKKAEGMFRESFPNAEKMRHSVAHQEFYANPDKDTTSRGGYSSIQLNFGVEFNLVNGIEGDDYVASWQGEVIRYSLAAQTLATIKDCVETMFAAFANLDPYSTPTIAAQRS
ncbi:hypothetical protein ASE65_10135 [Sphingomonas sp. Leaf16]|nr:hypothetical protein ASE65_10135 [Sphingomonas sp. Leaf16]KQN11453.1 hypothetical protein ASE81_11120 [Sphingomonas sp. Leaf29]KQN18775.1 hypothetical protein ASE83_11060 [Sphingomonas sp. Leaf32]